MDGRIEISSTKPQKWPSPHISITTKSSEEPGCPACNPSCPQVHYGRSRGHKAGNPHAKAEGNPPGDAEAVKARRQLPLPLHKPQMHYKNWWRRPLRLVKFLQRGRGGS